MAKTTNNTGEPSLAAHAVEIVNLKDSDSRQWAIIQKIQSRPPVWATATISLLTFLLGCSLTYAGLATRFAGMIPR